MMQESQIPKAARPGLRNLTSALLAAAMLVWAGAVPGQGASQSPDADLAQLVKQVAVLEQKVRELERGPSRVTVPFDVVDESGSVLARFDKAGTAGALSLFDNDEARVVLHGQGGVAVMDGNLFAALRIREDGRGSLVIRNGQRTIAELAASPDNADVGYLTVNDSAGESGVEIEGTGVVAVIDEGEDVAGIRVDGGDGVVFVQNGDRPAVSLSASADGGALSIMNDTGTPVLSVAETPEVNARVRIGREGSGYSVGVFNAAKQPLVSLGEAKVGGGTFAAYNAGGTIGAVLSGTGQVHVAGENGQTFATMVAENGQGAFSVRNGAGTTIVRLGEGAQGGKLEIADSNGNAMVEAGVLPGRGIVRAFPLGTPGVALLGMPGTFISGFIKF